MVDFLDKIRKFRKGREEKKLEVAKKRIEFQEIRQERLEKLAKIKIKRQETISNIRAAQLKRANLEAGIVKARERRITSARKIKGVPRVIPKIRQVVQTPISRPIIFTKKAKKKIVPPMVNLGKFRVL